eukprot:Ihof_evm2s37 gene=Ihof_evmTU2s37
MSDTEQEVPGTRIFIGNLPFKIQASGIEELLQPYGKVLNVKLAKRYNRFLGFAFAVFEEASAATAAVAALNKTQYQERELSIEIAHSTTTRKPRAEQEGQGEERRAPRMRRRNPRRAPQEGEEGENHEEVHRAPRNRAPRGSPAPGEEGTQTRRPIRDRTSMPDSETLLFVSNLPYSFTDEDLAGLFQGLSFTNARVVKRSTGVGRGFGFVDMSDHAAQLDAMQKINNSVVDGRTVVIKVAK